MPNFGPGNDLFFSGFSVIFFIIFGLILSLFIVAIVKGVKQWNTNNNSPILTVEAKIIAKRIRTRHSSSMMDNDMHTSSSYTDYYITFEVESGDRLEFEVPDKEYGVLIEGDQGRLTFQGTRYQSFLRS